MKKENKFTNVLFCIWVFVAFAILQLAVTLPLSLPLQMQALTAANGDLSKYQEIYFQLIAESNVGFKAQIIYTCLSCVLAAIWFLKGYRKTYSEEERAQSKKMMKNGYLTAGLIFGTLAFYCFDVFVANGVATLWPAAEDYNEFLMSVSLDGNVILSTLIVVVLAPINEELIYRGIILRKSTKAFTAIVPIILVQAILFGVMHMNPVQSAYAVIIGVFFGFIAYKYKSIIPSIFAHVLNNGVATLAGYLPEGARTLPLYLVYFVVFLAAAICFFVLNKKKNAVKEA